MLDPTKTDPNGDWEIVDNVTCLRPWGGEGEIELTDQPFAEAVIGSDPTCSMVLDDETHHLSRMHARLVRHGALWTIHDLASKNGTWIDGKRRAASAITPGTEIRVGGVVLVAESQALIALRDLLRRWIGWSDARRADVDRALRAVREAFAERVPLFVCGDGDLESIAARLHRQTLGSRPFVVQTKTGDLQASYARASRGTLCIEVTGKPLALAAAIATARTRSDSVRLTLCAPTFDSVAPLALALGRTTRIDLPRIPDRRHEVHDIVRELGGSDPEPSRITDEDWGGPCSPSWRKDPGERRELPVRAGSSSGPHPPRSASTSASTRSMPRSCRHPHSSTRRTSWCSDDTRTTRSTRSKTTRAASSYSVRSASVRARRC